MFFDTHTHYDDEKFADDRIETISRVIDSGVSLLLNVASDIGSCRETLKLAEHFDELYAAVGIHPHSAASSSDMDYETLQLLAAGTKVVAVGEIGLDYYYDNSPREIQRFCFEKQINLARKMKLPIIIHNRDAHEDTLKIIKNTNAADVGGVFHCYSGSVEMLRDILEHNFYVSVGGPVTYKNTRKLPEVLKALPDDKLLIETDCPYLAPEPFRGRRNDSGYLPIIAKKVAEIKGRDVEYIASLTMENAKRLFKIK